MTENNYEQKIGAVVGSILSHAPFGGEWLQKRVKQGSSLFTMRRLKSWITAMQGIGPDRRDVFFNYVASCVAIDIPKVLDSDEDWMEFKKPNGYHNGLLFAAVFASGQDDKMTKVKLDKLDPVTALRRRCRIFVTVMTEREEYKEMVKAVEEHKKLSWWEREVVREKRLVAAPEKKSTCECNCVLQ